MPLSASSNSLVLIRLRMLMSTQSVPTSDPQLTPCPRCGDAVTDEGLINHSPMTFGSSSAVAGMLARAERTLPNIQMSAAISTAQLAEVIVPCKGRGVAGVTSSVAKPPAAHVTGQCRGFAC